MKKAEFTSKVENILSEIDLEGLDTSQEKTETQNSLLAVFRLSLIHLEFSQS